MKNIFLPFFFIFIFFSIFFFQYFSIYFFFRLTLDEHDVVFVLLLAVPLHTTHHHYQIGRMTRENVKIIETKPKTHSLYEVGEDTSPPPPPSLVGSSLPTSLLLKSSELDTLVGERVLAVSGIGCPKR